MPAGALGSAYRGAGSGFSRGSRGFMPWSPYQTNKPATSSPLENQYKLYDSSVEQQGGDYSNIMQGYKDLIASMNSPGSSSSYTPELYNYSPTEDYTSSIKNLQDLSKTGGYSDKDIANIRARGLSPIRSIYANAQRDINRRGVLQGGPSANYGALKAKMARELSDKLSGQTTNIEGDIAERVAQNKLAVAPQLAGYTGSENALRNQYGARNADTMNEAKRFNIQMPLDKSSNIQQILESMRSLYGTTPAMSALYGGQALNTAQFQNLMNQQGQQGNLQLIGQLMNGFGG